MLQQCQAIISKDLDMNSSQQPDVAEGSVDEVDHGASYKNFEKRILRKVDFWLVGFYSLVYIFRVIDSSNYSNAAIINLEEGTNIKTELVS